MHGHQGCFLTRSRLPRRYGIIFWCPLIIDALLGSAEGQTAGAPLVALLTALPFGVSAVAIFLNSSHSKATGELSRQLIKFGGIWSALSTGPLMVYTGEPSRQPSPPHIL